MTKETITERINAIAMEYELDSGRISDEDFNFLVERALKSVRKSNGVHKPTKNQVANEGLKADIVNALGEGLTATDAGKAVGISVQKASALLKQLVDAGEVVKEKDGKTLLFKVAE